MGAEEGVAMQQAQRRDFGDILEFGQGTFERGLVCYQHASNHEEYAW
eukprot:CAMPEP_0175896634 /NCGR_PEP_ID=MMETSP0108-20121206/274_1 /TAXON_ID=195067 ORGANISM="Goniomonas pacifica, Strain CCMP1869" /NCGR_SAMPLE_ID=MMETSP0108 /ASSEMBLY_ACC=CAM_ASM_000204 /LENGTH=46 /DNA_ID= /DNA_START= /DNA_END= /DNA_ORIENTATION=